MNIDDILKGQNYNSSYNIILNSFIHEYDISKANINALYSRGVIDKPTYDNLYNSDKAIREKQVGLMIRRDQNIYREIQNGIIDAKRQLIITNNNFLTFSVGGIRIYHSFNIHNIYFVSFVSI